MALLNLAAGLAKNEFARALVLLLLVFMAVTKGFEGQRHDFMKQSEQFAQADRKRAEALDTLNLQNAAILSRVTAVETRLTSVESSASITEQRVYKLLTEKRSAAIKNYGFPFKFAQAPVEKSEKDL